MTYPKVIAFLIPGPSCYGNITLLLSKSLMWLFLNYDLTLLEGTIPTICSLSALPKVFKAPSTGRTARDKQPQGCASAAGGTRERAKVLCFIQIPQKENIPQPCPQHRVGLRDSPQLMGNALTEPSHFSPFETAQLSHQPGWVFFLLSQAFHEIQDEISKPALA